MAFFEIYFSFFWSVLAFFSEGEGEFFLCLDKYLPKYYSGSSPYRGLRAE